LTQLLEREPRVEVINQPAPGLDKMLKKLTTTMESGFEPLARAMNGKLVIDVRTYRRLGELMEQLRALGTDLNGRRGAFSGDGNPAAYRQLGSTGAVSSNPASVRGPRAVGARARCCNQPPANIPSRLA